MFNSSSRNTASAYGPYMPFSTPTANARTGSRGVSGSWGSSSYTPQYGGQPSQASRKAIASPSSSYNTGTLTDGTPIRNYAQVGASYGNSYSGGEEVMPEPILQGESAKQYAKSAGLANFNLEGMTYEEADKAINQMKDTQKSQVNALTSAVYSPDAVSNVEKRIKDFSLRVDDTNNNTWMSGMSKKENVDNLLKSTAKDLADQFDSPDAMAKAYFENPTVQKSLDTFAQYGGSDQMLIDAVKAKQPKVIDGNVQTTMEYQANLAKQQEQKQTESMMNGDKIITDEIAREAKIPDQLKDAYFGETGIWQQQLNLALEKVSLIKQKMSDERADARAKANLLIEKNNAELSATKNQIELNRTNAKNYLTGMLAKLGALNTTSAAVDDITVLDQKYQQQSMEAEQKVRFANQEIQIKLQDTINDLDNTMNDKIQSIQEDLSKDKDTMLKDIMKEKLSSQKRMYELTLKASDRMKKNNDDYKNSATMLAEDYATKFSDLVNNQGFDPASVARNLTVKLPAEDQRISASARIKDPNAIAYFKSLPIEFRNQWIQFATTQPTGTYFTLDDLKMNYEPYVLEQQQKAVTKETKKTNREI